MLYLKKYIWSIINILQLNDIVVTPTEKSQLRSQVNSQVRSQVKCHAENSPPGDSAPDAAENLNISFFSIGNHQ